MSILDAQSIAVGIMCFNYTQVLAACADGNMMQVVGTQGCDGAHALGVIWDTCVRV